MIRTSVEKPFIEIDGVKYFPAWRVVKLADMLLRARGGIVHTGRMKVALTTHSKGSVHVYMCRLKKIVENHDYVLLHENNIGWRLVKALDVPNYQSVDNSVRQYA